jgi:Fic family protein
MFPYDAARISFLCGELDQARRDLDSQITMSRAWLGRLRRELEAEAIAASTSMEGIRVTVDEVRRILVGETVDGVSDNDRRLVEGYREAMSYVLRRSDAAGFRWEVELIVALHDRVLAGHFGLGAGRLREKQVWVRNDASGDVVFTPPEPTEVLPLLRDACETMERGDEHPALKAAWFHLVIAAIHPFADGNGRAARVLASLAMYRGGFRRPEFTSLEEWWGRHLADYYSAFQCLGDHFDPHADVTPFIESHVRAQVAQVRALRARNRVQAELWTALVNICEEEGLEARLADPLWEAFFGHRLTAGYYRAVADISSGTVTNDLGRAVAGGLLDARGRRGGRWYAAGGRLHRRMAEVLGIGVPANGEPDRAWIISLVTDRLFGFGPEAGAIRRFLDECRALTHDQIVAADLAWSHRFDSPERDALLASRQLAKTAVTETPAAREAWVQAQEEVLAIQSSTTTWRSLLHRLPAHIPDTFVEAALLAVVARNLIDAGDYCRLVATVAAVAPWVGSGCSGK